jgi:ABC-type multidrug transport system ATPase subunit
VEGTISLNGVPVTNWSSYRTLCAYVEQDDLLFHTLTVLETLMLAAQLRLPRAWSYAQRRERVDHVISELGLRKCANTRIGNAKFRGVSGGERKRVSIALEILRGPQVLFLDECTSGLDSFQALRVVETIKDLAAKGRTIVTSIHQPRSSIYSLFDDLILLSEGQLMYSGPASTLVDYFGRLGFEMPKNFNPADFALDLVSLDVRNPALEAESRARHERIRGAIKESAIVKKHSDDPAQVSGTTPSDGDQDLLDYKRKYEAPYWKQFLLLAQRAIRQKARDPSQVIAPFCVAVFFGLILGFVYFQNAQNFSQKALQDKAGILFFISLNQSFNGMIAVVTTFPIEKEIVNRERSAKSYAVGPYFFSKVLADLPMLICPFTFFIIAYWITGFKADAAAFFQAAFICLATYMCANGIGLVASALMGSPEGAQAIAMPFMREFEKD